MDRNILIVLLYCFEDLGNPTADSEPGILKWFLDIHKGGTVDAVSVSDYKAAENYIHNHPNPKWSGAVVMIDTEGKTSISTITKGIKL
jgi:hypothetical protein